MSNPDLSEFVALSQPKRPVCGITKILQDGGLKPREKRLLEAALAAPADEIAHAGIERWLVARGHKVGKETVSRHRNKRCACDV